MWWNYSQDSCCDAVCGWRMISLTNVTLRTLIFTLEGKKVTLKPGGLHFCTGEASQFKDLVFVERGWLEVKNQPVPEDKPKPKKKKTRKKKAKSKAKAGENVGSNTSNPPDSG